MNVHTEPNAVVIGYGYAGRSFHSYLIDITPGLKLHGVASRNPATRKQIIHERGCKAYDCFDAVLADPAVALVVLATPNSTHADMAIRAMEAGKHVITDKVICLTLDECERMIATATRTGKMLTVFQNRRWDGDFLTVRQLMADGRLGDVRWIEMAWQKFGPPAGWRGCAADGGGRFYDLGAHLVDQLLLLFPQAVKSVSCRMHHDFPSNDVDSHAMIIVDFEDGATGVCNLSSLSAISKPRFHVFGIRATFITHGLDPQEVALKAGDIDSAREDKSQFGRLHDGKTEAVVPTLAGRWRNYYENIVAVLTDGAEPLVKLTEARRVIALLDAARRAARLNQVLEVQP